jgi:hypothetical protein
MGITFAPLPAHLQDECYFLGELGLPAALGEPDGYIQRLGQEQRRRQVKHPQRPV